MTHEELLRTFIYEPETGMLRRISGGRVPYPWRGAGKDRRYLLTTVRGENLYLHRLVWLYHHGYTPDTVDHINRDTRDNRIENLRPCSRAENQYNSKRKSNNRSGFKGIVFHPKCLRKPWQAKIVVEGKVVSLGYHPTKELAAAAYAKGAETYAGAFARTA